MRKFFVLVGILVVVFLFVVIGFGLFLMLAPGAEIFGVKYISNLPSTSAEETVTYTDGVEGDLVFDTAGVPITIEYQTNTSFVFEFIQKYNGFTRSKIDKANISVGLNKETGNLEIKTNEFVKFLWGSNSGGYALNCRIPSTYAGHNITVSSESSKVTFKTSSEALAEIKDLTVLTSGQVGISGRYIFENVNISKTKKAISIPQSVSIQKDVTIDCGSKAAKIATPIGGNLKFNSKGGSLEFVSAANLVVETKGGKVLSTEKTTNVFGNATLKTGSGNITLQHIVGNLIVETSSGIVQIGQAESSVAGVGGAVVIQTKSGQVHLNGTYANDEGVKIKTSSGKIFVGDNTRTESAKELTPLVSVSKLEIEASRGQVEIEQAANIVVKAKKANVNVGKFLYKAEISTTTGSVTVSGSTMPQGGELVVSTTSGKVSAKKLSGATTIKSDAAIDASFVATNGKIEIVGAKKAVNVTLPKTTSELKSYFWIDSAKTVASINVGILQKEAKSYHTLEQIPEGGESKLIKVTSTSGKIVVKAAD